jgi:hypothetical protein
MKTRIIWKSLLKNNIGGGNSEEEIKSGKIFANQGNPKWWE